MHDGQPVSPTSFDGDGAPVKIIWWSRATDDCGSGRHQRRACIRRRCMTHRDHSPVRASPQAPIDAAGSSDVRGKAPATPENARQAVLSGAQPANEYAREYPNAGERRRCAPRSRTNQVRSLRCSRPPWIALAQPQICRAGSADPGLGARRYQLVLDGVQRRLRPARQPELAQDVAHMGARGALGDEQRGRDLLVAGALADQ